ncbi:alpha/beta hydrolase [Microlunatus speluncae]|uniref:alpha/beta hydrolase n=1 Tax=Microlunatus speluncae TaxID=2594267 RepID=UPI0012667C3D|nr:alpha/beta fold hydrolase [Microlunatus speluncae]
MSPAAGSGTGQLNEGAEPFRGGTGEAAVLLCHGFTGSPKSLRAWAEDLVRRGFTVDLPRLPGHGTDWRDLNVTEWTDWYDCVDSAFVRLAREHPVVFVVGLSMGGSLALRLAAEHADRVAGVILVNPSVRNPDPRLLLLPVLKRLTPSLAGITNDIARPGVDEGGYDRLPLRALHSLTRLWRDVRGRLDRVTAPLLLFRSATDHVVDPSSARLILETVNSSTAEEIVLRRSYHVATMDVDAREIFDRSAAFCSAIAAEAGVTPSRRSEGQT